MSHRTQITLTDEQYAALRRASQDRGVSLAELIRRAVTEAYSLEHDESDDDAFRSSFGAWEDRDFDGKEYVVRLRRGLGRRLDRSTP